MVTAEAAVAVAALVATALLLVGMLSVVAVHLRVGDAARVAARAAARGEGDDRVRAAALRSLPGADVALTPSGDEVVVVVGQTVRIPLLRLWTMHVEARAVAPREEPPP